jgi:molybdenum cofactor guanylyltransferase
VNPVFSALVMAGGRSTRMGRPKALVEVNGVTLWRRQVDVLLQLGPAELMITAGTDWDPGVGPWTVIRDRIGGLGPLGGLDAALSSMSTELLLVLAVDMPAMSAHYLRGLVDRSEPKGMIPEDDGFCQGLAAVYPRSIAGLVSKALEGSERSLQHLIAAARAQDLVATMPIAAEERVLFRNVNLPTDL